MPSDQQRKSIDRVWAFYQTLEHGRAFNSKARIDFLQLITDWPREKAARFCGLLSDFDAQSPDGLRSLAFHLLADSGRSEEFQEEELLVRLTGWSKEYAEHAIELFQFDGDLSHRIDCADDGNA
jgi:hypothetical protein